MDSKKKSIVSFLVSIIVVLTLASIYIIFSEKNSRVVLAEDELPTITFKEDIVLPYNLEQKDNDLEKYPLFINEEDSTFDKVLSVTFSQKKTGDFIGGIKVELNGKMREFYFKYKVKDKQGPTISLKEPIVSVVGNPYNLNDYIVIKDNSSSNNTNLGFSIQGEIDWFTVGEYPVKIIAQDDSGNISELDVTVSIIEDPNSVEAIDTDYNESEEDTDYAPVYPEEENDWIDEPVVENPETPTEPEVPDIPDNESQGSEGENEGASEAQD